LRKLGKSEAAIAQGIEKGRQEMCDTLPAEESVHGAKTRLLKRLKSSCENRDLEAMIAVAAEWTRRTCKLWFDDFALDFKRTPKGQWLSQPEQPGYLSRVLKIYELAEDKDRWSLTETRVPTSGSDESLTRRVWSSKNLERYDLPCEFVE
jgi:hypothetical protein